MAYGYVCVAGTFDGLHAGHIALLRRACDEGTRVLIGLTSDAYVRQWKGSVASVHGYGERKTALSEWLTASGFAERATIIPIDDPFEPAASDPALEALVVSEQSRARGETLNRMRQERGYAPVPLVVVPMVRAEDRQPISATRVREGVIDRSGRLTMPDSLRTELSRPLGRVLSGERLLRELSGLAGADRSNTVVISVGDRTTKTLLDAGVTPDLMIIDNKVNRHAFDELVPVIAARRFPVRTVASGPGYISRKAIADIREVLASGVRKPTVLDVEGEEDLLALPAIMEAPVGAYVYYGQPSMPVRPGVPAAQSGGIVEVHVTDAQHDDVQSVLAQFIA